MTDYDNKVQVSLYITPELREFLRAAWDEKRKSGYVPFSVFVGDLLSEWKEKVKS